MSIVNPRPGQRLRRRVLVAVLALCSAIGCLAARAEPRHDLLFFLSVEGFDNLSDPVPSIDNSYLLPVADVIYAYNKNNFRFLGEYVLSNEEAELERFQFGWQANNQTMLWLGRFHTIAKYWTTEYHHGQFLQTSISRPGMEAWEDESGPLPSHLTGVLVEHEISLKNQSIINLNMAAGLGPVFKGKQLEPFDLFNSNSGNDLAINLRIAMRPDAISENQFGVLFGWNEIPVRSGTAPALADLSEIDQFSAGVFADWRWNKWRAITSWMYVDHDLDYLSGSQGDQFVTGYIQAEYQSSRDWTFFGRVEGGFGEDNSPYLISLPAFVAHRHMLGARWDFMDQQSFSLELADTSTQGDDLAHDNFKELRVQWSAVFP